MPFPVVTSVPAETKNKPWYTNLWVQVLVAIAVAVFFAALWPKAGAAMKPLGDAFIRIIQMLLGHRDLSTTARYTQVAATTIGNTASPFDRLKLEEPGPT